MYCNDKPIETASDDLLARSPFASSLAKSLLAYQDTGSLCVGLYGPWGSGKTSLVNLIVSYIEENGKANNDSGDADGTEPVVFRFNPWNFASKDQLIRQFFLQLADQFAGAQDYAISVIGNLLKNYSTAFELIPFGWSRVLSQGVKVSGDIAGKTTIHGDEDLNSQRMKIISLLAEQKHKIIITIDDIDRLTNEEIQLVFQLVASVANFPHTIFLLSFDKDIVLKALSNLQADDGNRYLEKIVQVAVEVPAISGAQLRKVFASHFDPYIAQYKHMVFNEEYWAMMSSHVFSLIDNIRDIIRLSNSVQLKLNMIGDEINFVDLITITALELKQPRLYEWIRNNSGVLTQSSKYLSYRAFGIGTKPEDLKAEFTKLFEGMELSIPTEEIHNLFSIMFPVYAKTIGNHGFIMENENLIHDQRIGHYSKFDRYFVLSIGESTLPRTVVDDILKTYTESQIHSVISESAKNNSIDDLLQEITASKELLDDDRKIVFIKSLISCLKDLSGSSNANGFYISPYRSAENLIIWLMSKVDSKINLQIISDYIEKANADDLPHICSLLCVMLITFDRIRPNRGYPKMVLEEQLDQLGKEYIHKSLEIDRTVNLMSLDNSFSYDIIQYFDPELHKEYIEKKLSDPIEGDLNKLRFLASCIEQWGSGKAGEYRDEHPEYRRDYITDDELDRIIDKCVSDGSMNKLTNGQAMRVASFWISRNTDERFDFGISGDQCENLLKQWNYKRA